MNDLSSMLMDLAVVMVLCAIAGTLRSIHDELRAIRKNFDAPIGDE